MSSFNSSVYAGQQAKLTLAWPTNQSLGACLQFATVPYALAGTEAANDTINLCTLPVGSKVIPSLSRVVCQDPGTALTLHIGTASDNDSLSATLALTTAHDLAFTGGTAVAAQYVPVALASGDETIIATVAVATSLTTGAKLLFLVAYTTP